MAKTSTKKVATLALKSFKENGDTIIISVLAPAWVAELPRTVGVEPARLESILMGIAIGRTPKTAEAQKVLARVRETCEKLDNE